MKKVRYGKGEVQWLFHTVLQSYIWMCQVQHAEEGENQFVDSYITNVYTLAKHCGYRDLHDEIIRDRNFVGIHDSRLSERMQMETDLTLEKPVTPAWQSEAVKMQQLTVRGELSQPTTIEAVNGASGPW